MSGQKSPNGFHRGFRGRAPGRKKPQATEEMTASVSTAGKPAEQKLQPNEQMTASVSTAEKPVEKKCGPRKRLKRKNDNRWSAFDHVRRDMAAQGT